MKRALKITGYILGTLLLLVLGFAGYIQINGIPTYDPVPVNITIELTPDRISNGMRIASMQCVQCHADEKNMLTGRFLKELPQEFGKIYSKNITHDNEKGIGAWTNGELYYFLRTGVRSDGTYAPPYMPKFALMADEDLKDVIAWLRSDSFGLQASQHEPPECEPSFLVKFLTNTLIKATPYQTLPIFRPDTSNAVALGEYYANGVSACFTCHSKDLTKINNLVPAESVGYYGGGSEFSDLEGNKIISKNLTFDETGIAHYSEEQFVNAVRFGKKPDGSMVLYPMVPHTSLTDKEVKGIYAFLKTVPKIKNEIE